MLHTTILISHHSYHGYREQGKIEASHVILGAEMSGKYLKLKLEGNICFWNEWERFGAEMSGIAYLVLKRVGNIKCWNMWEISCAEMNVGKCIGIHTSIPDDIWYEGSWFSRIVLESRCSISNDREEGKWWAYQTLGERRRYSYDSLPYMIRTFDSEGRPELFRSIVKEYLQYQIHLPTRNTVTNY